MPWFTKYVESFVKNPGQNDAAQYGVMVVNVPGTEWRCIGVHLLTGAENGGQHNVFMEPVDATGKRVSGCVAGWTWKDKRPDENAPPTALDKPPAEPAGNIPLGAGQVATVWLIAPDGAVISDRVSGLTTAPDKPDVPGATRFHQSYFVCWQRGATVPVPPTPDPTPDGEPMPKPELIAALNSIIWLLGELRAPITTLSDAITVTQAGIQEQIDKLT